jgi:hypothetical protein
MVRAPNEVQPGEFRELPPFGGVKTQSLTESDGICDGSEMELCRPDEKKKSLILPIVVEITEVERPKIPDGLFVGKNLARPIDNSDPSRECMPILLGDG